MKNTSWNNLEPGQIVSFIYQSKNDDRAVRRYVIVIDPKYVKQGGEGRQYFVGLQLHKQGQQPIPKPVIGRAIKLLGGLGIREDGGGTQINVEGLSGDKRPADVTPGEVTKLFNRLRILIGQESVLRTFDLIQCRKRRVFLETDYAIIPQTAIKTLDGQIRIGTGVVIED